jgi:hypothetical protein
MTMRSYITLGIVVGLAVMIGLGSQAAPYYEAGVRYLKYGLRPCDEPKARICGHMWHQKHA